MAHRTKEWGKGLVTIAIPAYKSQWIKESIESALSQDYTNIELIIVDDHSPHNLKEIVRPYLSDPRVRYYYNEKNLGKESIVLNWNKCLELAKGEFFILLCDDDILQPNFVSTLLQLAEKYPQCNTFHGRRFIQNMSKDTLDRDPVWPEYETCKEFLENDGFNRSHTIMEFMFRTEHVQKIGYFVLPLGWGSDDVSILRFMEKGGIASSKECIATFRQSDIHISGTFANAYDRVRARIIEFEYLKTFPNWTWTNKQNDRKVGENVAAYFPYMSLKEKYKTLCHIPIRSFPFKRWIKFILLGWSMKPYAEHVWN